MQNAECRMQNALQNADADADADCIAEFADQKTLWCYLKRLVRQKRWAGFHRSRAFRRAGGVGLRALGEGAFSEETWPTWWQHRFEMVPKWLPNGTNMAATWGPGGLLEASWRSLGALVGQGEIYRGIWGALGGLLGRSWGRKKKS